MYARSDVFEQLDRAPIRLAKGRTALQRVKNSHLNCSVLQNLDKQ
jgi:hypothetical protein